MYLGGIAVGQPQNFLEKLRKLKKIEENFEKIAVLSKGNCGQDLENFSVPDSGHGKRCN